MGNDVDVNPLFTIKPRIDPLLGVNLPISPPNLGQKRGVKMVNVVGVLLR